MTVALERSSAASLGRDFDFSIDQRDFYLMVKLVWLHFRPTWPRTSSQILQHVVFSRSRRSMGSAVILDAVSSSDIIRGSVDYRQTWQAMEAELVAG